MLLSVRFVLTAGRRIIPFCVPPLALLLFVAQVFVQSTEVIFHLAQVGFHLA